MAAGLNEPSRIEATPRTLAPAPRSVVVEYARPGAFRAGQSLRHAREAVVFLGLLSFACGCFGGFIGNISAPDGARLLGAVGVLGCSIAYVLLRIIETTSRSSERLALGLGASIAIMGAAIACAVRFPHQPLRNPEMLFSGAFFVVLGGIVFALTRFATRKLDV